MTREEAMKHLSEWMDEKMWRCFGTIDREAIGMAIEALHREEAEENGYCHRIRPKGEWIEKGGELVCSVCGNSVSFSRTPKGWVLGKFCQSCGTRMKGGDGE